MLLGISWLIPAMPLIGGLVVSVLLLLFNRTVNRLTKPITFFLIVCITISVVISGLLFINHIHGISFASDLDLFVNSFHISFYLDDLIEKVLIIVGVTFLVLMLISYYALDRQKGYVRYMAFMSIISSIALSLILTEGFSKTIFKSLPF